MPEMNLKVELSPDLSPAEEQALRSIGKDPADYATITVPAAEAGFGFAQVGPDTIVVLQSRALVPHALLRLPMSRVMGANGQGAVSAEASRMLPVVPVIRYVVARDALAGPAQENLRRAEAARDARAAGEAPPENLPPLPFLRAGKPDGEPQ